MMIIRFARGKPPLRVGDAALKRALLLPGGR